MLRTVNALRTTTMVSAMKLVALISGGKDSCYNMMQCVSAGHEIVALAHMKPKEKDELDSFMYQCVGHDSIQLYSEAMGLPLYQGLIEGENVCKDLDYVPTDGDEVEDLYELLKRVKESENIDGVASGAILSNYQRTRVENVCSRLGLTSYAYLWRQNQAELLADMIAFQVRAIFVKVATLGLEPEKHLGKEISELYPHLLKMEKKFGLNVCGEGGEYETFTLDCPLFKKRIVVDELELVVSETSEIAPVGFVKFKRLHLDDKPCQEMSQTERMEHCGSKGPINYLLDLDVNFRDVEAATQTEENDNGDERLFDHIDKSFESLPPWVVVTASGFFSVTDVSAGLGDPAEETRRCLEVVTELLAQKGLSITDLIAVQLFVRDMGQFMEINAAYRQFFNLNPPSRVCVQVPLPADVSFVLSCTGFAANKIQDRSKVAVVKHMHVQGVSHWAPANIGPYSQSVMAQELIYVAGQIGLIPGTMQLIPGGIHSESDLALRSVQRVLEAINPGTTLPDVIFCVCYVTNIQYCKVAERVWRERCWGEQEEDVLPNVFFLVVPALPRNAKVEWHVLACRPKTQTWNWAVTVTTQIDSLSLELQPGVLQNDEDQFTERFLMAQCVLEDGLRTPSLENLTKAFGYLVGAAWPLTDTSSVQFQIYYSCSKVSRRSILEAWSNCTTGNFATISLVPILRNQLDNCIFSVIMHYHP